MAVDKHEYIRNVHDKPRVSITDPEKTKQTFTVQPAPGGFIMYEVVSSKGNLPAALSGYYSSMSRGVEAVELYLRDLKPTKTVQRDKKAAARN